MIFNKNTILGYIFLCIIVSCNDEYLERYPLDELNDRTYWTSSEDIRLYANQFYPDLSDKPYIYEDDDGTDNNVPNIPDPYTWNQTTVPQTGGGWSWGDIRSCNYALVRIADMQKSNEVLRFEGEIRFFRAKYYFELIKRFGDVPWLDRDLQTNSEELYKPRDPRKVVFDNVLNDLEFAIEHLPDVKYADDRLTKYAALALKTEACLYEGTYRKYQGIGDYERILQESASAAESIINSELFSLYTTGNPEQDFYQRFVLEDLTSNPETILCDRLIENVKMNNRNRKIATGRKFSGLSKDLVESFLCIDGLPISISPLYQGDSEFDDQFINRDSRMHQSIYYSDDIWLIYDNGDTVRRVMPVFNFDRSPTSFIFKKFRIQHDNLRVQNKTTIDAFIYRYSEVLVSYAEAKAELDECTQEVLDKSVNLLRDRVNMVHLEIGDIPEDPSQNWEIPVSPLIHEIRRERRIETISEGKRWDDLVRWKAGKRLEDPKTILGARDPETGEYKGYYSEQQRIWDDKLYLRPIPRQELALNPDLEQNPGWE